MNINIENISKYANIATVVLAIIITMRTCSWDEKLKGIEVESRNLKLNQENTLFDREFKFKIYDLTINAIKSKDKSQQEAALLVVQNMVPDTIFKKGLINLFIKSSNVTPEIQKEAKFVKHELKIASSKNPIYSESNKINVDIYYLEDCDKCKKVSERIFKTFKTSEAYKLESNQPLLLTSQNNNYTTNQVRYFQNEKDKAENVMNILNDILYSGDEKFEIVPTTTNGKSNKINIYVVNKINIYVVNMPKRKNTEEVDMVE